MRDGQRAGDLIGDVLSLQLGHLVFAPFGLWMSVAGGSIAQILLPIAAGALMFHYRDYFGAAITAGLARLLEAHPGDTLTVELLERVGEVSDLPILPSPIQLGTDGRWENDAFTVVGRIIYEYERGGWSEWHCITHRGRSLWLADAQAEYAVSTLVERHPPLPAADHEC